MQNREFGNAVAGPYLTLRFLLISYHFMSEQLLSTSFIVPVGFC